MDIGDAVRNAKQVGNALRDIDRTGSSALGGLSTSIDRNAEKFRAVGGVMTGVGLGIVAAFGGMASVGADFEQTLSGIGAVTDVTGQQMEKLSDLALKLGADTSFGANDAAMAMEVLAKAGVDVEDILNGAAESAVLLAEAGGGDLVTATEVLTSAMAAFNIEGEDSIRVADALAGAANVSKASINDLGLGLAQVGGVANAFGISIEETTAALAVLADNGLSGSDAATSLKTSLLQLASPTAKQAGLMEDLGIQITNADGSFKSLTEIIGEVDTATQHMTESQRIATLEQLVGQDGVRALTFLLDAQNTTLADGTTEWEQFLEATSGGTSAADVAAKRMDNLKGDIEELTGAIETIAIKATSALMPAMRTVVQFAGAIADAIGALPTSMLAAIAAITAVAGALLLLGGVALIALPNIAAAVLAIKEFRRWGGIEKLLSKLGISIQRLGLRSITAGGLIRTGMGIAVAAIRLLAGALRSLLFANPLLTALGIAIMAYAENWLGFRDIVNGAASAVVSAIRKVIDVFLELTGLDGVIDAITGAVRAFRIQFEGLSQTSGAVSAFFGALAAGIRSLDIGPLNTVADFIDDTRNALSAFFDGFRDQSVSGQAEMKVTLDGDDKYIEWQEQEDGSTKYAIMQVEEDGSITEVGEILESWDDPNDPNLIHARVEVDGQEFETTIDRATGEIHSAEVVVQVDRKSVEDARDMFDRLDDGLAKMQDRLERSRFPFLAEIPKQARKAVDWFERLADTWEMARKTGDPLEATLRTIGTMFPELGRATQELDRRWQTLQRSFAAFRELGVNPVSAGLLALRQAFPALGGVLLPVANAISSLTTNFERFRDAGMSPVQAGLAALAETFPRLSDLTSELSQYFDALGDVVNDLVDAFQAAIDADWSGMFAELGSAAQNAWQALQAGIGALGALALALGSIVVDVAGWIPGAIDNVWDWLLDTVIPTFGAALVPLGEVAAEIENWLITEGIPLGLKVASYITGTALPAVDKAARSLGTFIVNISGWLITETETLASRFGRWFTGEALPTIKGAARDAGTVIVDVAAWLVTQTGDLAATLKSKIVEWVGALSITSTDLITVGTAIVNGIEGAILAAVPAAFNIITEVYNAVTGAIEAVDWSAVGNAVGQLLGTAIKAGVGLILAGGAMETIKGLLLGVFVEGLGNVDWGAVGTAIGNFLQAALQAGFDFAEGLVQGLFNSLFGDIDFTTVTSAFDGLKSAIEEAATAVGELAVAIALIGMGAWDAIKSGVNGVKTAISTLNSVVGNIIGKISSFVSQITDLGTADFGGIGAGIDGIATAISAIGSAADTVLGPLESLWDLVQKISAGPEEGPVDTPSSQQGGAGGTKNLDPDTQMAEPVDFVPFNLVAIRENVAQAGALIATGITSIRDATIRPGIEGWQSAVSAGLVGLTATAATGFAGIGPAVTTPLANVGLTIGAQALGWKLGMQAATIGLAATAAAGFAGIATAVIPPLTLTATAIATRTAAMRTSVATNFAGMSATAGASTAALNASVTGSIAATAASWAGSLGSMLSTATSRFSSMRSTGTSETSSLASSVSDSMSGMASTSAAEMLGMQVGTAAKFLAMKNSGVNSARDMGAQVVSEFASMGARAASVVSASIGRIPGIIGSFAGSARSAGFSVGAAAGDGIVAGLYSRLGAVQAAANAIVNTAMAAMAVAAALGSPSKITTYYGEMMSAGLIVGIAGEARNAVRAAQGVMDSVLGVFNQTPTVTIDTAFGGALASAGRDLTPAFAQATTVSGVASITINNEWQITQLPGESGEALARRVADMQERDFTSVFG